MLQTFSNIKNYLFFTFCILLFLGCESCGDELSKQACSFDFKINGEEFTTVNKFVGTPTESDYSEYGAIVTQNQEVRFEIVGYEGETQWNFNEEGFSGTKTGNTITTTYSDEGAYKVTCKINDECFVSKYLIVVEASSLSPRPVQPVDPVQPTAEEIAWQNALSVNIRESYHEFERKYPNSKYLSEARSRLSKLEAAAWSSAKSLISSKGIIEAYNIYLMKYPNGKYAQEAKEKIRIEKERIERESKNKDDAACELAKSTNTIASYDDYLNKFPNGKCKKDAKEARAIIVKEDSEWQRAKDSKTKQSYEEYLKKYPKGRYAKDAKEELIRIENEAWTTAGRKNTVKSYKKYLSVYPNGKYAERAKEQIVILEESAAWSVAKSINTKDSYEGYLKKYPNGRYAKDAKKALEVKLAAINNNTKKEIEDKAWQAAKEKNTISAYRKFIGDFSDSEYVRDAEKRIAPPGNKNSNAGISSFDINNDCITDSNGGTILIKPKVNIALEEFVLHSKNQGKITITIQGPNLNESTTKTLIAGKSQISTYFLGDLFLLAGNTYTLILSGAQISNASNCVNSGKFQVKNSPKVELEFNSNHLLSDIIFRY